MEALCAWLWIADTHTTWGYVWLGVAAVVFILSIVYAIMKRRNTIVVCSVFLRIEHVQRLTKDYKWEDLDTVDIEWSNIKHFSEKFLCRGDFYY